MDEKRQYFRIKNHGEMKAFFNSQPLQIIDISAASIALTASIELPSSGSIELSINLFSMQLDYEFFTQRAGGIIILLFPKEEQREKLLPVLKNLRNEHNRL